MVDDSGAVLVFSLGQERLRLGAWGDDSISRGGTSSSPSIKHWLLTLASPCRLF